MSRRLTRRTFVVTVLSLAGLTGCGTDPDTAGLGASSSPSASAPSTPSVAPTTPVPTTPSATPTSTLPPGVDQVVRLTVRQGKVSGAAALVTVRKGSVVQLVVTSDVADEIHLHTYDKSADVAAGGTASLTFRASIAGTFEVELEKRGLRLARIRVQ